MYSSEIECPQIVYTALFASTTLLVGTLAALSYAAVTSASILDALTLHGNAAA